MELESTRERKIHEHSRRDQLRLLQMAKNNSKEKVLYQLMKPGSREEVVVSFLNELVLYLESCLVLARNFAGLTLLDKQQLTDREEGSFYFMLKLNYTFYLIRARGESRKMRFTFLCDFTSLNAGKELQFTLDLATPSLNSNQLRLRRMYMQGVFKFAHLAEHELGQSRE